MGYLYAGVGFLFLSLGTLIAIEEHRITTLEQELTTLQVENREATKKFTDDAKAKQEEYENDRRTYMEQFNSQTAILTKRIASRDASIGVLNSTIATFSKRNSSPVPTAAGTSCSVGGSEVLAGLLEQCNSFLGQGISAAQSAANQISTLVQVCK